MLTTAQLSFLSSLFPGDAMVTDPVALHGFGADASRMAAAPWAAVRPDGRDQLAELLRWADAEGVPLFPRGRATNVVGGAVPQGGGVVVSLLRLNRIREVDADDFVAVVEPGVVTAELQRTLAASRLFYPPDPASAGFSTVGGNIASGAGGMRALKYGATRDFVLGVEAVLPGGKVLRAGGRCHKNVVGLDLTRLFVGSEGTLGIVTEATLKLLPLPEASASLLACFDSLDTALEAVRAVFQAGALPAALEFLSGATLRAIGLAAREVPWGPDAAAALLVRLDGGEAAVEQDARRLAALFAPLHPVFLITSTGAEEDGLWELRRTINQASFKLAPDKLSDDVTVPRSKVGDMVRAAEALGQGAGLPVLAFGHLGDGNLHINVMFDAADQGQAGKAAEVKAAVLGAAVELGGTLSGEHGVGLAKLPYLDMQLTPLERSLMAGIKQVFDPHAILNPGKAY